MGGVVGVINDIVEVVVSEFQEFAENVVAAAAQILNDFLNVLAGPAAHDKEISEFSTQNSYLYTNDAYIDNLYNTDRIALNSLIKGTSITDEIIDFYKKVYLSSDFDLQKASDIAGGSQGVGYEGDEGTYAPLVPDIECNFDLGETGTNLLADVIPSATLRVNNTNLYAGSLTGTNLTNEYDSSGAGFTWHTVLDADGNYNQHVSSTLDSDTFSKIQTNTKDYLKALGIPDPETLLDDLPYDTNSGVPGKTYSDVIDSAFLNFRVKWVSGLGSATGNRISNKYLYLLAKAIYDIDNIPHELTYETDENPPYDDVLTMFQYTIHGDGHNYTMGLSHVSTSTGNNTVTSSNPYQYDRDLTSSDGYYYYDANKTLPNGEHSANTVAKVQEYLDDSTIGTEEGFDNWLEIEQNSITVTVDGVDSVFPDEIQLPIFSSPSSPGITLKIYDSENDTYINAADQVLRVGNLYIKISTGSNTTIQFATVPASVYSTSSITYGKSNTTGVTYYTAHNVTAIERITDYGNETNGANTTFRYISHKLDVSNACVSAPVIWGILEQLDPLEQHKLIIASANLSLHLAFYLRIPATLQQKLLAAVLNIISIGLIIYTVISLGSAGSFAIAAEIAITAYATSIAINAAIEHILVPIIISNFGEDEALVVLAIAAVAIAYYSRKSGTTGLNQFPNQVALFTATIDIMNQMYTLAVVQPGIIEMQKEQDEWTATDNELTEKEEAYQEDYDALFGTEDSPSHLLNLQTRAALNPMPASAYFNYHDTILERQFDCFDYDKYNELNVS